MSKHDLSRRVTKWVIELGALTLGINLGQPRRVRRKVDDSNHELSHEGNPTQGPDRGKEIRINAARYAILDDTLFRKSFLGPYLKCLDPREAEWALKEIHQGTCGNHSGDGHRGTLPTAVGGKKFVLLATDYFTKWVEAEAYKRMTQAYVAYRTTKQKSIGESPFSLAYGTEAVIPIEIRLPTVRTLVVESNDNEQQLAYNLDMLEKQREASALRLANYQNQAANYFNKRFYLSVICDFSLNCPSFVASRVKFQLIIIVIWGRHKPVLRGLLTLNRNVSELLGHLDPDLLGVGRILLVPITCGIYQFLLKAVNLHSYSALAASQVLQFVSSLFKLSLTFLDAILAKFEGCRFFAYLTVQSLKPRHLSVAKTNHLREVKCKH
ncbi:hypothetical protein L3X38_038233 [Prunus dulcis]|uniref:Uncharacterized protein n=1 Tax=Prunus dulcis TaxID=3755 RepID=A0AAD4V4M5_PRUDU|nr:hypothetical protein L3X38_038233 [Prunus dulcis]